MSSEDFGRIKGFRTKTTEGYSNFLPFGTDGFLTDMVSGLDLEEELIIGGNHYISIAEDIANNQTIIQEQYYNKKRNDPTAECILSLRTIITAIPKNEYLIDQNNQNIITDNNNGIIVEENIYNSVTIIQMQLYKGTIGGIPIHTKQITIVPPLEDGGNYIIDEILDKEVGE